LVELGGRLDHPAGDGLLHRVREVLDGDGPAAAATAARPSPRRVPRVLMIAAAIAIVATAAVPAVRRTVRDLFGTDASRSTHATAPTSVPPSSTTRAVGAGIDGRTRDAVAQVAFPVHIPNGPTPTDVAVDHSLPGGMITLRYPEYTVSEVGTEPDHAVTADRSDPNTHVTPTTVRGAAGYWITGTHHAIAFVDRAGVVRTDTIHTEGHVLVWSEAGVVIRIEGPTTLGAAQAVAASLT
ncbi:MAG: hypothetical protein ACXV8T_05905, partial [Acidimicrobiia bacterium]